MQRSILTHPIESAGSTPPRWAWTARLILALTMSATVWAGEATKVTFGKNGEMRIDGKPFFPIFVWNQPTSKLAAFKEQGINTIIPGNKAQQDPRLPLLDQAKAAGMYVIIDNDEYALEIAQHPAFLCWKFGDEPDMWKGDGSQKVPFDELQRRYTELKGKDPNHPAWTNLSPRFFTPYNNIYVSKKKCPMIEEYRKYAVSADVLSYDHYPVTGWNQPTKVPELFHATVEFASLYQGKPIWVIVENADQDLKWTPKETRGPTPQETRAMVWMCIVAGAKGIGYFPIAFNPFRWDNTTAEMKAEMKRLNTQITGLTALLLDGEVVDSQSDNPQVKTRALRHDGKVTVLAVNLSDAPQSVNVTANGTSKKVDIAGYDAASVEVHK